MGVPKFFRWLTDKYPDLIIQIDKLGVKINNLFLDANCLIHPCCSEILNNIDNKIIEEHLNDYKFNKYNMNENLKIYSKLEKIMFEKIYDYIVYLTEFIKPDLLFIAIDGVAPRAKMEQQRLRRYRSYKEKKMKDDIYIKFNKTVKLYWDKNIISPGTLFIVKLSVYLQNKLKNLKNIKILLSDANRPGEGEHKIINYIDTLNDNIINCIYGLDADLIMLSLCKKKKIYLLRESVEYGKINSNKLLILSIPLLKTKLFNEFLELCPENELEIISHQIIIDYIFLCFLLGNDFLPSLVNLNIDNNAINTLFEIYSNIFAIRKKYLINEKKINWSYLQQILNNIYNSENINLNNVQKKIDNRYIRKKIYKSLFEKELDMINYYPIINKDNRLKLGKDNWHSKYYYIYFNISDINQSKVYINNICNEYIKGLQWNLLYYLDKCISWNWYYPYIVTPCLREICQFLNNRIYNFNFKKTIPYNPLQQLSLILPRQSFNLLPKKIYNILSSYDLDIIINYPEDFIFDKLNKVWFHECIPILPKINDKLIIEKINKINFNKLELLLNTNIHKLIIIDN